MKLVGDAMHKGGLIDVPVVGIAPWNAVHGRATLEGCKGQEVFVRYKSSDTEGRLNPYHTHQILVDSGSNAATWGGEIALRARLERTYATQKGVPVVLLVVQGGPGTLDMMLASAELGCPLLVLADSGGAASAIAQFCECALAASHVAYGRAARATQPAAVQAPCRRRIRACPRALTHVYVCSPRSLSRAPPPTAMWCRSHVLLLLLQCGVAVHGGTRAGLGSKVSKIQHSWRARRS